MIKKSIIVSIDHGFELANNFYETLIPIVNLSKNEIVTVIDGCKDFDTLKYLKILKKKNKNFKLIHLEEKKGYSCANNIGVENAKNDVLVFINSDVFPFENSIDLLSAYLVENNKDGIVQGMLIYPQTNKIQSTGHIFGHYFNFHAFEGRDNDNRLVNQTQERQALTSAFYSLRKSTFFKHRGFDEFYFNAWEGMELSLKVNKSGYKCIYYPKAKAYHARGGGRRLIHYNNQQQDGFFWSKWGNIIDVDIVKFYQKQVTPDMFENLYYAINFSYIRTWEIYLNKLKLNISNKFEKKHQGKINFFFELPFSFLKYPGDLLFFTDFFNDISSNKLWVEERNNQNDIVMDLRGNLIPLRELI